ncbi:hypothetical protein BCR43DRAFT_523219 [Syncephalastrum racemosum]|uniref:SRA1/Sec31 domain-containing protein n=1 Tax=Syncephalastrum racemosum TaxID=13706 RepID=A0A1X2HJE8_SYNRA|nr:hypothetical protein BCR43DRAFT_523219 [Syncephalastrum racemosum]
MSPSPLPSSQSAPPRDPSFPSAPPKAAVPPPPPKASAPPKASDFRTATIENHWNDPPKTIFRKPNEEEQEAFDKEALTASLTTLLDACRSSFTEGSNKRIFDDTEQRIQRMEKEIQQEQIPSHVLWSLSELVEALQKKQWDQASTVHTRLMTTEYDKHGAWLIGLKRLIDLAQKASHA